jgi:hypothetical protein
VTCKPGSLLEHLYAVKREHEKQDLAFLTKGITHYATKSLGMEYEIIHGPESLAPRKREALAPDMAKALIRAVDGLQTTLRGTGSIKCDSWLARYVKGLVWLPRRAGSSGISWRIHSLVKKTLHRHRADFEPQRASSFMKRVKASQILGEAVRA